MADVGAAGGLLEHRRRRFVPISQVLNFALLKGSCAGAPLCFALRELGANVGHIQFLSHLSHPSSSITATENLEPELRLDACTLKNFGPLDEIAK